MSYLYNKNIDNINEEDISELIENQVFEDENLEYKREINPTNKKFKQNFLKEVCAFCNSDGGLLIYGIGENVDKTPYINGIGIENVDDLELKLRSFINHHLDPRPIPHINISYLNVDDKNVLVVKASKSFNGPVRRRINSDKTGDFYIRHGNESVHMTIDELRNSFNLSGKIFERIHAFKEKRIGKIYNKNEDYFNIITHLIPFESFTPGKHLDLSILINNNSFKNIYPSFSPVKYNLDGIITYADERNYSQFYDNGVIESCLSYRNIDEGNRQLSMPYFETLIVGHIENNLKIYKDLNINLPIFCFITISGVYEKSIYLGNNFIPMSYNKYKFDRNILKLPEIIFNHSNIFKNKDDLGNMFKFTFDKVYHAAGQNNGSPNYDSGSWNPKKY